MLREHEPRGLDDATVGIERHDGEADADRTPPLDVLDAVWGRTVSTARPVIRA
jgi:hypothetical protein